MQISPELCRLKNLSCIRIQCVFHSWNYHWHTQFSWRVILHRFLLIYLYKPIMDWLRKLHRMGLLPDRQNYGLCMRRECRVRFSRPRELAIPTCITACAWYTCRDACRDRLLAVSFEVGGGENVPGIPGTCATRNFAYLVRGPWCMLKTVRSGIPVCIAHFDLWDITR